MAYDREHNQHEQPGTGSAENPDRDRKEQFNELSELSLEERMAVADRIGIPVDNVGEAAATGTASGADDASESLDNRMEEENRTERPDR